MPGPKEEERAIGDCTYRVTQLTSEPARRLFVRLFNVLGPSIGQLTGAVKSGSAILDADLSGVFATLARDLTPDELEAVIKVLCDNKTIAYDHDGKWPKLDKKDFDFHFTGEVGKMFKVLAFAIEVNYRDFLGEIGGLFRAQQAAPATSASSSPTT